MANQWVFRSEVMQTKVDHGTPATAWLDFPKSSGSSEGVSTLECQATANRPSLRIAPGANCAGGSSLTAPQPAPSPDGDAEEPAGGTGRT